MSDGDTFSDEELERVVQVYNECGRVKTGASIKLGLGERSLRRRLAAAAERGMLLGHDPAMPGFVITSVSEKRDADGQLEHSHIRQVRDAGEERQFELPPGHVVKGVSALVDSNNNVSAQWIKTKIDDVTPHLVEALKATFSSYEGAASLINPPSITDTDLLSVYPLADQHNGLLAWGKETGESYDLKIGEKRLRDSMARLVSQSPSSHYALILNLGDFQHNDSNKNMTPESGNLLDVDSRYFKILTSGVKLMQDCIELALQKHQQVLIVNIPGNHDPHASIALTVALSAFYHNEPRVTVYDQPADWFFHRFGSTLIGATHGHRAKPADMAMTMAVRARQDWGQSEYRYFYFGHVHHESAKEIGDVRVESFQTLAANDAWHNSGGYCSGKSMTSITIHRNDGEIGRHRVNIPSPLRKATKIAEAA